MIEYLTKRRDKARPAGSFQAGTGLRRSKDGSNTVLKSPRKTWLGQDRRGSSEESKNSRLSLLDMGQ